MAAVVLRILEISSSTYYAWKKRQSSDDVSVETTNRAGRPKLGYSLTQTGKRVSDEQIKEWLMELICSEEGVYGYKKLTHVLRQEHELVIGKNKVYTICVELDILQPKRQLRIKHPRRLSNNLIVTGPNQLWQMDIKYGYVAGSDRFFYLLCIIDVYDRVIVEYHIGPSCRAQDACMVVLKALQIRSNGATLAPIIRTDNGPQFVSNKFEEHCEELGLIHERIPPRTPNKNAYIESFHSIIERELLEGASFETFEDAYFAVKQYIHFYNHRRIHGSLKYLSPLKFHQAWQEEKFRDIQLSV